MILGSEATYTDLLLYFPPRLLTSEADYEATLHEVSLLLAKNSLTNAEREFLALLSTLVQAYEEKHYPLEEFGLRGVALIKGLMELHEMTVADLLPVFETATEARAVLENQQPLTVTQINRLASFFSLPHEVFFEPLATVR